MRILAIILVLAIVATPIVLYVSSSTPSLQFPQSLNAIGRSTPIAVRVIAPHGVREM
jgi:hypothetical protein